MQFILLADAKTLKASLGRVESELVPLASNLVDKVWGDARPPRPKNQIFPLDVKYSGKSLKKIVCNSVRFVIGFI